MNRGESGKKGVTRRDFVKMAGIAGVAAAGSSFLPMSAWSKGNNSNFGSIDAILEQAAANKEVPGVAALAANDKGVIYEAFYGLRDLTKPTKMTPDTMFWYASMTKAVTSVAVMQLVEQGKLKLDDPIGTIVSDLASPQVLEGFKADGEPVMRPAKRPVTLRHLMTHTSGLGYTFCSDKTLKYATKKSVPRNQGDPAYYRLPLLFDPGEGWQYGVGIDWAGRAVEIVSGQRLNEYMQKNILDPLGMKDTGFDQTPEQQARLATVHARQADGSLKPIPFRWPQKPAFYAGGAGLHGTPVDYLTLLRMLLNDGQLKGVKLLKPETVQLMRQNHIGNIQAGQLKTSIPGFSNDLDFWPGMQQRWGLSFLINTEQTPQGRSAGSITWAGLGNCYYWVDYKKRVCGVILTQIFPFADKKTIDLFNKFEAGIYKGLKA